MYRTDDKSLTDKEIIDGFLSNNQECHRNISFWIDEIIQRFAWKNSICTEDICSDTIYKLLMNFRDGRFNYNSTLKAYVQQITRFTLIDAVRLSRRQPVHLVYDPPEENTPISILMTEEEKTIFNRIWNLIDDKCKELWVMIFHERRNYKDIAKKLKLSENTIKSRVFRCKEEAIRISEKIT